MLPFERFCKLPGSEQTSVGAFVHRELMDFPFSGSWCICLSYKATPTHMQRMMRAELSGDSVLCCLQSKQAPWRLSKGSAFGTMLCLLKGKILP